MASSVVAKWHGDKYQQRFFWIQAAQLRNPHHKYVIEVSYEADGPKAFDDVVVKYDPAKASPTGERIRAAYYQIKFHVTEGGRFGYANLIEPEFIGAKSVSILERLRDAQKSAPQGSVFHFITTDKIRDDDPLGEVISTADSSLRWDKLSVGGDRSKMGRVRKLWRDHLGLSDGELKQVLAAFRIEASGRTLEALRDQANLYLQAAGLQPCTEANAFSYDGHAQSLREREMYVFTRPEFEKLCVEEGWVSTAPLPESLDVSLRSFSDGPTDIFDSTDDHRLNLAAEFDGRQPRLGVSWADIAGKVRSFLGTYRGSTTPVRLHLEAHVSFAFLAGDCLGLKSGVSVELVQKGRTGLSIWRADDGRSGPLPNVALSHREGSGSDVALVLSLTRDALADVQRYLEVSLPIVTNVIQLTPDGGPGLSAVAGGEHAAQIADAAADAVKKLGLPISARVHLFIAGPNSVAFFLGQHAGSLGRWTIYEYDFNRQVDGSYR